jgi:Zn-dependent metalloprotease
MEGRVMIKQVLLTVWIVSVFSVSTALQAGDLKGPRPMKTLLPPPGSPVLNSDAIKNAVKNLLPRLASSSHLTPLLSVPVAPTVTELLQQRKVPLKNPDSKINGITNIRWNASTGVPRRIEVASPSGGNQVLTSAMKDPVSTARSFLVNNKTLLRIEDPVNEFSVISKAKDERGITHVRFKQMFHGFEVWSSDVYVHISIGGYVYLFNGSYLPTPALTNLVPKVGNDEALQTVRTDLETHGEELNLPPTISRILKYKGPISKQVVWHDKKKIPHLVWFIEIQTGLDRDWYYFVDAQNGTILHHYNNTKHDGPATGTGIDMNGVQRTFGTYSAGANYFLIDTYQPMYNSLQSQIPQDPLGAIVTLDLQGKDLSAKSTIYSVASTDNQWADPASVSAQYNSIRIYNYFRQVFGRNSIDDKGMTIYSIIHATENGQAMDNAYWAGAVMCYGDGNVLYKSLAGGFDVAVHEMTHGVTQYTANLTYEDQSGALNESVSDVFAAALDSSNWTMGEEIIKSFDAYPSGSLRDLSNPHNSESQGSPGWQPLTMGEFITTTLDNGGVHINSGIPNNAFYRVAMAVGRPTAIAIWYKALTHFLTSMAQFIDARIATEEAAIELYGASSIQLTAVKNAWDAVQVYEGSGTEPPPPSELSGDNWILVLNTDPGTPNTLYMSKPVIQSIDDYFPLSTTAVLTRPAVSDTSGVVLFVDTNNQLRVLNASPQNPGESILDNNSNWWSVTVGPGLGSFALTSKYIDTTIYYFDLVTNQTRVFKIRSSTYDGPAAKTAIYADAMSFDPTGQFLLFDTYNQVITAQGDSISYWTINLLDVRTGDMRSVFAPQP